MTNQTSSNGTHKVETYPRILIQPDWAVCLRSNSLPADIWVEYKSGSDGVSRITQNVHGVCSIKPLAGEEAKAYKASSNDHFQPVDIDKQQQQFRVKFRDSEFSHTFQGFTIFFTFEELIMYTDS